MSSVVIVWVNGCTFSTTENDYKPPPPPEVTVARPVQQDVTLFVEENGETEPVDHAEVRARVRGFLEDVRFEPGQRVNEGDVLYVIEQSEYQAAVNSAKAVLETAQAAVHVAEAQVGVAQVEVTRAELEFERYKSLLAKDAATQSQYDVALAARDAAKATHDAAVANVVAAKADRDKAQASLERSQLDLDYTQVKAPIGGRITKTEIKLGNLVENGSLMANVVDRSRIYANFNLSDHTLLELQQSARKEGDNKNADDQKYRNMPAYLHREIDKGYPFQGHLDYVDQEGVDQATGTYAIRAIFENNDDLILPGLFVRIRVPVGQLKSALLVPEVAIVRDQQGTFLWVVGDGNKLKRQPVTTGPTFEDMIVVTDGLRSDEWVLLDGQQRARPGAEVSPLETTRSKVEMMEFTDVSGSADAATDAVDAEVTEPGATEDVEPPPSDEKPSGDQTVTDGVDATPQP